ncbi:MAG: ABC transporter ATP-binding protein [Firmicutes bacterium]|nr:ABC transporter ATP-binding protein [Bacillota bacterium]
MEKKKDFNRSLFSIFFSYFGPHKKLFIIDMTCAFFVAIVDIAFPLVSRFAMYELLPGKIYKTFFTVMAIMLIAFALRAIFYYLITYIGHTFGIRVEADIREDLYKHFQVLDFDFYDKNRTGKLMNRLTGDLFEITELAHHGPEDLLISIATIIGALIVMFAVEWRLAIVVLVMLPLFAFIVMFCRKRMVDTSVKVKVRMADINADIESTISGMKTSKAFDNSHVDYKRFEKSNETYKNSKGDYYKAFGLFNGALEFSICTLQVAVIAFGGWLIMREQLNYIDLITFTLYITTFITPVRKLATLAELFASGFAGLTRFVEIMRLEPSIKETAYPLELADAKGDIRLSSVVFSYDDGKDVLNNVTLDIKAGECIAIVGHSGGGKSTLCQLLPRFYDVDSGSITIDGIDVRNLSKSSLRQNIGIVQQDVFLFADTILENIRYGRPDATFEEVVEAAKKAEIYDDIMAMEKGFDTYVGERGTLLSGGQKQRVSIARIFLKNPRILILDEATSALDSITEQQIQKSFSQLSQGRTTLIIAHRLATIKDATRIVLIEDGRIKEMGTHEELMELGCSYTELYNAQSLLN